MSSLRLATAQLSSILVTSFSSSTAFSLFPFETQRFKLNLESFKFPREKDFRYQWQDIQLSKDIDFHDFKLLGHRNGTRVVVVV